jgi:PPIC-type PPIASE domain.
MSVIQTIRDRAWIIAAAIAIALIAFIVQDAFQGGGGMGLFGGQSTTLGIVNGKKIDYREFQKRVDQVEKMYADRGFPMDDQTRHRVREDLWNQFVEEAMLRDDLEDLGITVTSKELGDMMYGDNPPPLFQQWFRDSAGQFDADLAYRSISSLQRNNPFYNLVWNELVPELERSRLREKFLVLLAKSAYVPKWRVEKTNAESSQRSNISYVYVPYASIPDSTITVTDEEVRAYVNKHSKQYQQPESRSIQYVSFDAGPTSSDSAEILNQVLAQKEAFEQTEEPQAFLLGANSETPFYDGYVMSSKMQMVNVDSLRELPVGAVLGPYIDGDKYVLAKKVDQRMLPDTVTCRHILIKISDENGPIRPDSTAKKLIDSIADAIKGGASFSALAAQFSDDGGSKTTGGEYTFSYTDFQQNRIVKEFGETIFYGKTGDKKIVRVQNEAWTGYHYIEVLNQRNFELAHKIAYLSRSIVPSQNTTNTANGLASQFLAESRTPRQFEENAKKKNLNVFHAVEIKPLDNLIMGLGSSREMVKWIYKADIGDVAETPFLVDDKFIVPMVTQVYEEGVMPVEKARPMVEYILKNEKKAEQIIKKIGNANTLEAVSQAVGQPVQKADSLSSSGGFIPGIGMEKKVFGAAFNSEYQNKLSPPIKGELGVFVLKVENIFAVPNPGFDAEQMQKSLEMQQENRSYGIIQALRKAAKIKDYRSEFY